MLKNSRAIKYISVANEIQKNRKKNKNWLSILFFLMPKTFVFKNYFLKNTLVFNFYSILFLRFFSLRYFWYAKESTDSIHINSVFIYIMFHLQHFRDGANFRIFTLNYFCFIWFSYFSFLRSEYLNKVLVKICTLERRFRYLINFILFFV